MIPPMNNPPNRLDQLRANAGPMPPVGGAPMSPPLPARRPPMPPAGSAVPKPPATLPTGGSAPMPPMEEPEEDRLAALLGGMEEEPMMPEEEGFSTSDVATGIATSALQISGSPEQALMAVEQAADELRAMLS
jgi:hypothetical protein